MNVRCRVCDREMKIVSNTHLATHGLTPREYSTTFPSAEMHSSEYRQACSKAHKGSSFPSWTEKYNPEELKKMRSLYREAMLDRLSRGIIPKTFTKPHRILSEALRGTLGGKLEFENEFQVKYYAIDIACPSKKIAVEVDGDFFHNKGGLPKGQLSKMQLKNAQRDKAKNKFLKRRGWRVLRFWESEILEDVEGVVKKIAEIVEEGLEIEPFDYSQLFKTPRLCQVCRTRLVAKQIIAGYRCCSRACGYELRKKRVISKCKECGGKIVFYKKRSFCDPFCQKKFEAKDAPRRMALAGPKVRNSAYHSKLRESRVELLCPCGKHFWKCPCRLSKKYIDCCSIACSRKYKIRKGEKS